MENKLENKWTKEVEKTFSTNQQLQRKDNKDKWDNKKHSSEGAFWEKKKEYTLKKKYPTTFIAEVLFRFEQGSGKHEYSLDYWTKIPGWVQVIAAERDWKLANLHEEYTEVIITIHSDFIVFFN